MMNKEKFNFDKLHDAVVIWLEEGTDFIRLKLSTDDWGEFDIHIESIDFTFLKLVIQNNSINTVRICEYNADMYLSINSFLKRNNEIIMNVPSKEKSLVLFIDGNQGIDAIIIFSGNMSVFGKSEMQVI